MWFLFCLVAKIANNIIVQLGGSCPAEQRAQNYRAEELQDMASANNDDNEADDDNDEGLQLTAIQLHRLAPSSCPAQLLCTTIN